VNVYSQELTTEVELIRQPSNTGVTYSAVRMILHSSDRLHHPPDSDDDRSAVTFWLPRSKQRRMELAQTFRDMANKVLDAPPEDGLD
jgi:hypothetical protein